MCSIEKEPGCSEDCPADPFEAPDVMSTSQAGYKSQHSISRQRMMAREMSQEPADVDASHRSANGSAQHQMATHASHWTISSPSAQAELATPFHVAGTTDLSEAVRQAVNKRMCQAAILTITTSETDLDLDAHLCEPCHKHRLLKPDKIRTADSIVVITLIWHH